MDKLRFSVNIVSHYNVFSLIFHVLMLAASLEAIQNASAIIMAEILAEEEQQT
jgi:hypothetical protein